MILWWLVSTSKANPTNDPVLQTMQHEMARSFDWLQSQEQPPYWMEVAITDHHTTLIEASNGVIVEEDDAFERFAELATL